MGDNIESKETAVSPGVQLVEDNEKGAKREDDGKNSTTPLAMSDFASTLNYIGVRLMRPRLPLRRLTADEVFRALYPSLQRTPDANRKPSLDCQKPDNSPMKTLNAATPKSAVSAQQSSGPNPYFTCHHCNNRFSSLDRLRIHMSVHFDPKTWKKRFCCVPNCNSSTEGSPNTLFFRAPKSPQTLRKWAAIFDLINIDYTRCIQNRLTVCENHFDEEDIVIKAEKAWLKKNALPKKQLCTTKNSKTGAMSSNPVNGFGKEGATTRAKLTAARKTAQIGLSSTFNEKSILQPVSGSENLSSGKNQRGVSTPEVDQLKRDVAPIIPGVGENLTLPFREEQKAGYPPKRILRVIKLPPGMNIEDKSNNKLPCGDASVNSGNVEVTKTFQFNPLARTLLQNAMKHASLKRVRRKVRPIRPSLNVSKPHIKPQTPDIKFKVESNIGQGVELGTQSITPLPNSAKPKTRSRKERSKSVPGIAHNPRTKTVSTTKAHRNSTSNVANNRLSVSPRKNYKLEFESVLMPADPLRLAGLTSSTSIIPISSVQEQSDQLIVVTSSYPSSGSSPATPVVKSGPMQNRLKRNLSLANVTSGTKIQVGSGTNDNQTGELETTSSRSVLGKRRRRQESEKSVPLSASQGSQGSSAVVAQPELASDNPRAFVPKFEKPTTRRSTGSLKKSSMSDDKVETMLRASPKKSARSPSKKVQALPSNLTPVEDSPPAKRAKFVRGVTSTSAPQFKMVPKIVEVFTSNRSENRGGFACCRCGDRFQSMPLLKLHDLTSASSCALQGSTLHQEVAAPQKMPDTDEAIRTSFDVLAQIRLRDVNLNCCKDPFEDQFSVVKQEDQMPAYIRDWYQHPIRPQTFTFRGLPPGYTSSVGNSAFDCFLHFVTPGFLDETCVATNRNIELVRGKIPNIGQHLAFLTVDELMTFLAIVIFHFAVLEGVAEWLGDYGLPVDMCMSLSRFKFLLASLSFAGGSDKLLEYFNERMRQVSNPPKRLLLKDSAILQSNMLVYSRSYSHTAYQGVLYNLSDADGTVHRVCLNSDRVTPPSKNDFPNTVVDSLMDGLLDKGYSLFVDDAHGSVQLTEDLLERETYCTALVGSSRIIAPPELHRAIPEQLLVTEWSTLTTTSYYTNEGICFAKCDEGREYKCVSSEWGAAMVEEDGIARPALFYHYKKMAASSPHMPRLVFPHGAVDVQLSLHVFALLVRNAFVLFTEHHPETTFADFQFEVAKHLLYYPSPVTLSPMLRSHLPSLIEGLRHNSVLIPRKVCDSCEQRPTVAFCPGCPGTPSLCPDCYRTSHEEFVLLVHRNPQTN